MPDLCIPWDDSRRGWFCLSSFELFGAATLSKLSKRFVSDGGKAWNVTSRILQEIGVPPPSITRFLEYRLAFDVETALTRLATERIDLILREDPAYPPLLKEIADPPFCLFVRGALPDPQRLHLAIVGTRACTSYGAGVAQQFGRDLGIAGIVIVSGLALGIDSITHSATLDVGGTCIAVLGTGVDDASLYPRANVRLAHRIIADGGAVLSEFPPGTGSFKHNFPMRNRIISGLCRGTIIIEAAESSGSLITAKQAVEQNRDVFAVPGPITSPQSVGTNSLLKDGAIPCLSTADVLDAFDRGNASAPPRLRNITEQERRVLHALEIPLALNDLARLILTNASDVSALLTTLELDGFVSAGAGKIYTRNRHWKE